MGGMKRLRFGLNPFNMEVILKYGTEDSLIIMVALVRGCIPFIFAFFYSFCLSASLLRVFILVTFIADLGSLLQILFLLFACSLSLSLVSDLIP